MDEKHEYWKDFPSKLDQLGTNHTAKEIFFQPMLWKVIWKAILDQKEEIQDFQKIYSGYDDLQVVLTGAGSSAFIGQVLEMEFNTIFKKETHAISTTQLVTHFEQLIDGSKPLLLVSFARSGNSPESTATIEIAENICDKVFHLVITCNKNGKLAQLVNGQSVAHGYVHYLPDEAEDKGLAMTGSFSGMALAGYLIVNIKHIVQLEDSVKIMSRYGKKFIKQYASVCEKIAERDFNRIFFLGAGPMLGIANESHLKVQELTDGKIIGKFDSFLGFRHGPRAVLDEKSILIYLFSNNSYVNQYEIDLAKDVEKVNHSTFTIGLAEKNRFMGKCYLPISFSEDIEKLSEVLWSIIGVLLAQMIGFFKSQQLGLTPDSPSVNGSISRVVEGVTIYPRNLNGSKF